MQPFNIKRLMDVCENLVTFVCIFKLNSLVGSYVNLPYRLPGGNEVRFLDDNATYLGTQLECEFGGERCFGVLAGMDFILVSTYGKDGSAPELVIYKKR